MKNRGFTPIVDRDNARSIPSAQSALSRLTTGFTLIELLVVIAVIGLLAAVILASLNSAREKGRVASIKSNLKSIVTQAQIYFTDNSGSYTGLCDNTSDDVNDPQMQTIVASIRNTGAIVKCYVHPSTNSVLSDKEYGIAVIYNADTFFTAGPTGVLMLDDNDVGNYSWDDGMAACIANGKRIPNVSALVALYVANNNTPPSGFHTTGTYWSSTSGTTDTTKAFIVSSSSGVATYGKASKRNIRCGS